jgi:hypothetical protein
MASACSPNCSRTSWRRSIAVSLISPKRAASSRRRATSSASDWYGSLPLHKPRARARVNLTSVESPSVADAVESALRNRSASTDSAPTIRR